MTTLLFIVLVAWLIVCLVHTDVPVAASPMAGATAMKPFVVVPTALIIMLLAVAGVWFGLMPQSTASLSQTVASVPSVVSTGRMPSLVDASAGQSAGAQAVVLILATLISSLVGLFVSPFTSVCYALMGAFMGVAFFSGASVGGRMMLGLVGTWVVAPLLCGMLSAAIYYLYSKTIAKIHVHFLKLFAALKVVVVVAGIVLMVGFSINNAGMLVWVGRLTQVPWNVGLWVLVALVVGLPVLLYRPLSARVFKFIDVEYDINLPCAIAVTLSTGLVLLFFSIPALANALHLVASPLALPTLSFLAILGVGVVQGKEKLERPTLVKLLATSVLTPVLAFFLSYNLCTLSADVDRASSVNSLLFATFVFAAFALLMFFYFRQRQQDAQKQLGLLRQQQAFENQSALNALDVKIVLAENQFLQKRLDQKRNELINVALNIREQKEFTDRIYSKLREADQSDDPQSKDALLREAEGLLLQRKSFSQEIDGFYAQAESLHKDFSIKLNEKFPHLTAQEKKLATLLRLGFSSKEIATLMNITPKSAEIGRYRLRKKLNLKREDNLIQYIKSL